MHGRVKTLVGAGVAIAAIVAIVAITLALRPSPRPAPASPTAPGPTQPEETSGSVVRGLRVNGVGPVLSWNRVKGSNAYQVAVRGPDGAWLWQGHTTSVTYGTIEDQLDYLVPFDDAPAQVMTARPGARYIWFVTAFSPADGSVAAVSPMSEFVYQPPAGDQRLPARAARRFEPTYECTRLVPDSVRAGALAGFTLAEGSPCGENPTPGCPWNCRFSRRGDDSTDPRVALYFDCHNSAAPRVDYPKLKHGTPLQGLGRSAEQDLTDDDKRMFQFQASAAPCMVRITSNLPVATSLELAKAVDAHLTWERLWLRPPDSQPARVR